MSELIVQVREGAARFSVRVQPRAARSAVEGVRGGALKVRLTAPPVEGAANDALIELLAERLHVPERAVTIVSGASARMKLVQVNGVDAARVRALVAAR